MTGYRKSTMPHLHPVIATLVRARLDRKWSQSVVAERLGITQVTMSRWENGLREVAFSDVVRWAAVFGLELQSAEMTVADGPLAELSGGGLA